MPKMHSRISQTKVAQLSSMRFHESSCAQCISVYSHQQLWETTALGLDSKLRTVTHLPGADTDSLSALPHHMAGGRHWTVLEGTNFVISNQVQGRKDKTSSCVIRKTRCTHVLRNHGANFVQRQSQGKNGKSNKYG